LGFQIELCCRYFGLFDLATFWAIFEKIGKFFTNLLVTLLPGKRVTKKKKVL
jgi:hypothetical protein